MKNWKLMQKIAVSASFVAMLVINILANVLPINQSTAQVSETYDNLLVPAGYTFMIWGLIYVLLAVYIMHLFGVFKDKIAERKLFWINNVFILLNWLNIGWLFCWHYELLPLSTVLIFAMLGCLIYINLSLLKINANWKLKLIVFMPFAIYFAWITFASIANVTAMLIYFNWDGWFFTDSEWTITIIMIASVIAMLTTVKLNSLAYALTIMWALLGVLVSHITTYYSFYTGIILAIIAALWLVMGGIVYLFYREIDRQRIEYEKTHNNE